jgi:hypothetical protein
MQAERTESKAWGSFEFVVVNYLALYTYVYAAKDLKECDEIVRRIKEAGSVASDNILESKLEIYTAEEYVKCLKIEFTDGGEFIFDVI